MSAVFTPTRYKLSVEDYHKLGTAGVLTEDSRVELIEGELIEMAPIGPEHASVVDTLVGLLAPQAGNEFRLSTQNPLTLMPRSEPQPDLMLLKPRADRYASSLPSAADVLVVIEVSDKTLEYDRGPKLSLYAQHGIPEYWIVDVQAKRIEVFRDPASTGYTQELQFGPPDVVTPQSLPGVRLNLAEVFA
jgi:Uma2 family endonuclease